MKIYIATGQDFATASACDDTWEMHRPLRDAGIQCLAADPRDARTVYAGSRSQGVWRSRDGGESWRQLELPQQDVFSVAGSPADGAVYADCEPTAVFVSRHEGETWH